MKILSGISRVIVGCLFIFSGFIKANDPIGFSYKLNEYYTVFGMEWLHFGSPIQAIIICVLEIVLGITVLMGTRMKLTSWLLLVMIIFFTFLTGFTAISNWFFENPNHSTTTFFENTLSFKARELYYMKDCGCFGDAIKLTPMQSFLKDVLLTILIVIIFIRRNIIRPFFAKIMQTNIIAFFTLISTAFSFYCYLYLPVINFLAWQNGSNIIDKMKEVPSEKIFYFLYKEKSTGEQKWFDINNLPTNLENYDYVDRKDSVIKQGIPAVIHDFVVKDVNGQDLTQSILDDPNYQLFVVMYDLNASRKSSLKKLALLANESEVLGYRVSGFTNDAPEKSDLFRHEFQLSFPFYQQDRTALKAMIRSNPGVILLSNGVVIDQWPSRNLPSIKRLKAVIKKHEKKRKK